ncbi:hypothetical protein SEA_GODONK_220 [Gordonia phage GodonK]|uniref:Uncharacterized protein n=1 Tax=Gordonia phage GodonK TaxID=2562192 RepID=A0A4D6E2E2_9CAUD|nr:hypothetical protein HOV33_gp148 [Gordonia phage GodonK]QBZ72808.1 hypothetical protein SEA_GODONK_220 [Gordonia phage GodonK]
MIQTTTKIRAVYADYRARRAHLELREQQFKVNEAQAEFARVYASWKDGYADRIDVDMAQLKLDEARMYLTLLRREFGLDK